MSKTTVDPLAQAIKIAATVHETQTDKAGAAYILHPLRMMQRAQIGDEQIVAVLHDVVEDSDWTLEKLRKAGFSPAIVDAVGLLTRAGNETYEEFVERIATAKGKAGDTARRVKLLDLEDNMNVSRLADLTDKNIERLKRYQKAHQRLSEVLAVSPAI